MAKRKARQSGGADADGGAPRAAASPPAAASSAHKKRRKGKQQQPQSPEPLTAAGAATLQEGGEPSSPLLVWRGDAAEVSLPPGSTALLTGVARCTVLQGSLDIAGKTVGPSPACLELCGDERAGGPLPLVALPQAVQPPLAAAPATLLRLASVDGTAQHRAAADVQAAGGAEGVGRPTQEPGFQLRLLQEGQQGGIALPAEWAQAAAAVRSYAASAPPLVVVAGPKASGKSSLARRLVNAMLNDHQVVAWLDCDCGQPELTPPGCVSLALLRAPLWGPSYTQVVWPDRCHFIGDVSPASDPLQYLAAIRSLYDWYCSRCAAEASVHGAAWPPLVLNTHGWIKGLGQDLLSELLQLLPVTHLLQLEAPIASKNLPREPFWLPTQPPAEVVLPCVTYLPAIGSPGAASSGGASLATGATLAPGAVVGSSSPQLEGAQQAPRAVNAANARALQWAAFARQCCAAAAADSAGSGGPGGGGCSASMLAAAAAGAGDLAADLAAAAPLEVALSDVRLHFLHGGVPRGEELRMLNGAVVGLASSSAASRGEPDAPPPPPCLALGIVRAVDGDAQKLYLLAPLCTADVEAVHTVLVGRLELPPVLLSNGTSVHSPYLALFGMRGEGTGAKSIRSRNNLLRGGRAAG